MEIWLKEVSDKTTIEDLRGLFTKYGEVTAVQIFSNSWKARVEMPQRDQARLAIKGTMGTPLHGQPLKFVLSYSDPLQWPIIVGCALLGGGIGAFAGLGFQGTTIPALGGILVGWAASSALGAFRIRRWLRD